MKALYADSDPEVRDYVSMLLEAGLDCEILEASSGNEALSVLEFDDDVDFILTEVQMKGGGGHLIVEHLDSKNKNIPIVFLSNQEYQDTMIVQEVLKRSPLNAFVPKPFRDDQFFPVIDKILNLKAEMEENGVLPRPSPGVGSNADADSDVEFDWDELDGLDSQENHSTDNESWDLHKKKNQEMEADWSLKRKHHNQEEEADWSLKAKGNESEQILDYRKNKNDSWDDIRKKNNESKKGTNSEDEEVKSVEDLPYDMERFKRVKIKRFYNLKESAVDIYIRLNEKKYLKLINQNEELDYAKIEKYEQRGQKFFYIENSDYPQFQNQFGSLVLEKLEKAQNLTPEIKAVAELAAFNHTIEYAKDFGITANTANKVKKSVESNLKTLKKMPKLETLLKRIMRGGDYISEHSLLVSCFAGQICMATSWGNHQTLEKLSMAALLHDISLPRNELARIHNLSQAKEKGLSGADIELIKSHPGEAAKLISQGENIFADVDTIVLQHHELPDQSGFPRGLGPLSISPLSCIFILASEFAEKVYGKSPASISVDHIKEEFKRDYNKGNFKKPLEALLKVF